MKFSHISIVFTCICVILIGIGLYHMYKDTKESKTDNPSSGNKDNSTDSKEKSSSNNENPTDSKEKSSGNNENPTDLSNDVSHMKITIPSDRNHEVLVNYKANRYDTFKDKKLFRALIYCSKAVLFIDDNLLKMVKIPNPNKEDSNKFINMPEEKLNALYKKIKMYREPYLSSDMGLLEKSVDREINNLNIFLKKLDTISVLKKPIINPKKLISSNLPIKNKLIEAISKAFHKDVQADILDKRFKYESIDYEFDVLDVYVIEAICYYISNPGN